MSLNKKLVLAFLTAINIINLAAGAITQVKILKGSDVTSIIPITAELTVNQILLLNFMCVAAIMVLISIVTTYLATDVPYSPKEILSNCPGIFLIIPAVILFIGIFNAINAQMTADKIWIALCSIIFFALNAVNFGCIVTVKEDADEV